MEQSREVDRKLLRALGHRSQGQQSTEKKKLVALRFLRRSEVIGSKAQVEELALDLRFSCSIIVGAKADTGRFMSS